ncbi:MAG: hypothetical protein H8D56_18250 [Planctomycetes bacterium]|nr:hypothetical protein [Planctomycetota bacterium]MBL7143795.1 hypothetical protein [Phycisphaerae bacterium]
MKTVTTNKLTKFTSFILTLLILSSPVFAYPPDPDNAALLYYQAYISYEKADDTMEDMVADLSRGNIEPNERIKKYIESCRAAIDLAAAATEIPNCNWGLKYSDGVSINLAHVAQTRKLVFLITAEARILAAEGDYQKAINRCLTVHKIGKHVGDDTPISFLVSMSIDKMVASRIQDILADMQPDLETLTCLKAKLAEVPFKTPSLRFAMRSEKECFSSEMQVDRRDKLLALCSGPEEVGDLEKMAIKRVTEGDEVFFAKNRDYYIKHMNSLDEVLESSIPYAEVYSRLEQLNERPGKEITENPAATLTSLLTPAFGRIYSIEIRTKTISNSIRTAVEIYMIKAKSGKLPDTLPDGLPGDLFSGKDFKYEKTADGFALRCQGEEFQKGRMRRMLEFKVKK